MGYSILIVDDSATTRAIIRRTIQLAGIPVAALHEAGHGGAALDLAAAHPVDLILSDLHMANMDGEEMTRRLKADPATAGIPVVVISAEPNAQRIAALRASGISGYLKKPFTPEGIRDVVNQVLGVCHA